MAGLVVAEEFLARSQSSEKVGPQGALSFKVAHVRLLSGGKSLAYSPFKGEFAEFLTVSGTDRYRRDHALAHYRAHIETQFRLRRFDFSRMIKATRITETSTGTFRIETSGVDGSGAFEAKKAVLALGHSLKEVAPHLQKYVIQGGGHLCEQLRNELAAGVPKSECLGRLLSRFKRTENGAVRIGLIGVGATTIEVVKVFETLLEPPSEANSRYRTKGSGIPVEFVVFAPQVPPDCATAPALFELMSRGFGPDEVDGRPQSEEFVVYKRESVDRFRRLFSAGQLDVERRRFNWDDIIIHDEGVIEGTEAGAPRMFSCLIDCAPFIEGFGRAQRSVIQDLAGLHLWSIGNGGWRAQRDEVRHKGRLALVGAAFSPKVRWLVNHFQVQARQTMDEFYPDS
jgi:hypothetical protein